MPENPYQPPKEVNEVRRASSAWVRRLVIGLSILVTMAIWAIGFVAAVSLFIMVSAPPWAFFSGCAIIAAIPAIAFQYAAVQFSRLFTVRDPRPD
jgi:hypothetical protein